MSDKTVAMMIEILFKEWRAKALINDQELMSVQQILWRISR